MPGGPTPPQQWLLVSNVHFTPYDDPSLIPQLLAAPASRWHAILATSTRPPSPYFSDTNFALFESALTAMQATIPNPPVVIIPGDFMAHKFPEQFAKYAPDAPPGAYDEFVDKTIAFLAAEFNATFPKAQFLITVGNNDGYCGNYMSTPNSPFLAHMAAAWGPLVDRNGNAPNCAAQFSRAGYYTATLPGRAQDPRDRAEQRVLVGLLPERLWDAARSGLRRTELAAAAVGGDAERVTDDAHPAGDRRVRLDQQ